MEKLIKRIEPERIYSTREVAELLGVNSGTVRYWIKKGWLKGFRVGGRFKVEGKSLRDFVKRGMSG